MKKHLNRRAKVTALCLLLLACLALTACYVPPDDTGTGNNNNPNGNSAARFETATPAPSPTPSPTPTASPTPATIYVEVTNPPAQSTNGYSGWTTTTTDNPNNTTNYQPVVTNPPVVTNAPATNTPSPTPVETLRKGSKGEAVRQLQQQLKTLGYYSGTVDGDYGDGTVAAVKAFQKANRLTDDGVAGEKTQKALFSGTAVAATATPKTTATPKVTNTPKPTATPKTNIYLEPGNSGANVKKLQQQLIDLGYLSGSVTGYYRGATEYAVIAFQKRNNLDADGKAGPKTLEKLYSGTAKKASQLAATIGETLYQGESGDGVRAMQRRLKELGYLTGNVDGSYGPATASALERFQASHGHKVDGSRATGDDLEALYSSNAVRAGESGGIDDDSGDSYYANASTETLTQGMVSSDVKQMQNRLKELGYYTGPVNGEYDSATVTAVMAFQTSRNLDSDGKAGTSTLTALYDENYTVTYSTLKKGSKGSKVLNLQQALYEFGYYTGAVDGSYGDGTVEAVRAFQSRNGLKVSGVADNETQTVLYSSNALEAAEVASGFDALEYGDSGEDVLEMKDVLLQLGYAPSSNNDKYDSKTEAAVRLFQERNGLTVDGVAGPATLKKLYSENAIAAE
ncbi:MAG: peptidoglycan-binding protein [Clostridia bacterium]|nr:peptidoglycan-binding protein [Clostridia bacterium]